MKIKIYQINHDRDKKRLAYWNLKCISSLCGGKVPADIYDCVFDGEVDADNLEKVFMIFNENHPEGYTGRSLSVSDVVEVKTESERAFYFCDTFGFKEIEFDYGG